MTLLFFIVLEIEYICLCFGITSYPCAFVLDIDLLVPVAVKRRQRFGAELDFARNSVGRLTRPQEWLKWRREIFYQFSFLE